MLRKFFEVLASDSKIDEVHLIPACPDGSNFVVVEHKLGIAFKVVPSLYLEALSQFHECRSEGKTRDALRATKALLFTSTECYSAFNYRKTCISEGQAPLAEELNFIDLVLSCRAKSGAAWTHRRWVVGRLLPSLDRHCQRELLSAELQVCSRCAAAHPKLYYAWNYRLWLCQHMDLDMGLLVHLIRQLRKSGAPGTDILKLLDQELLLTNHIARLYKGHEAVWCHRRALASMLVWLWREKLVPSRCCFEEFVEQIWSDLPPVDSAANCASHSSADAMMLSELAETHRCRGDDMKVLGTEARLRASYGVWCIELVLGRVTARVPLMSGASTSPGPALLHQRETNPHTVGASLLVKLRALIGVLEHGDPVRSKVWCAKRRALPT